MAAPDTVVSNNSF